jgi:hypothetical protein
MSDLVRSRCQCRKSACSNWTYLQSAVATNTNRSEVLRDLVREKLVDETCPPDEEVVGSITMVYDITPLVSQRGSIDSAPPSHRDREHHARALGRRELS